jgi:ATP-dependent protease Clp ATPase subunit
MDPRVKCSFCGGKSQDDEEKLVAGPDNVYICNECAWADYTGCWADVYHDDQEEMQACEAPPDPNSALGLCRKHEAEVMRPGVTTN